MRNTRFPALTYAIPLSVLALGAMLLIPGEEPQRAASVNEIAPRTTPSFLATSPDLVAELDASLAPVEIDEAVLTRETRMPDPTAVSAGEPAVDPMTTAAVAEPQTEVAPATSLRVGEVAVNMRAGPSTATGVIRPLQPGEQLVYGESQDGWVSVTTASGESGWVYSTYLAGPAIAGGGGESELAREVAQTPKPVPEKPAEDGRYARVGSDVYLRAGPSNSTDRLFVLPAGERVQIAETKGNWARVLLPSGASGWVRVR